MQFELSHDEWGRLVLTDVGGLRHTAVEPVRAFPISDPRRWISLVNADGVEVLWIDDLDALPDPQRTMLVNELGKSHFLPILKRIHALEGTSEPTTWDVETDRGRTKFNLKGAEDVRRIMGQRVLVVDAHGVRYLIPDLSRLDAKSRHWLERYI